MKAQTLKRGDRVTTIGRAIGGQFIVDEQCDCCDLVTVKEVASDRPGGGKLAGFFQRRDLRLLPKRTVRR